jgi:uncharacterized protein YprB with RNaseH-like and TPR domain
MTQETMTKTKTQEKSIRTNKLLEFSYVENQVYLKVETTNLEKKTSTTAIEIYEAADDDSIAIAMAIYKNPNLDLYNAIT